MLVLQWIAIIDALRVHIIAACVITTDFSLAFLIINYILIATD